MWQEIPDPVKLRPRDDVLIKAVQRALDQLSEKEQVVIRLSFQWYRPGLDHQRMPNDVVKDLAGSLQTTPENLRQIRRRALRKIRAFLEQEGTVPQGMSQSTEQGQ
jgi:DNA-directed RNA polymerase sigma subunit (sigma70/sigma32)